MRGFLLFFGWASLIGSLFDGAITIFAAWLAATGGADFNMSVDTHLKEHLSFIYWIKNIAYIILPGAFVDWIFGLPALIYFPVRVVTSIILGGWAFSVANRMKTPAQQH